METKRVSLKLKRLGIDTYKEAVIYIREDSDICKAEGFEAQARILVSHNGNQIIATLNTIRSELLKPGEAGLSEYAWELLEAKENEEVFLSHPEPVTSLSYMRGKIYGKTFTAEQIDEIIKDVVAGRYSDIHISAFLAACAGGRLNVEEISYLTQAMIDTGDHISWPSRLVVDKHCVGGLPGNRTTLIVVPIVAAFGLTIPKTSSRAITSSAGTADTMEALAPVDLDFFGMQQVVNKEGGCIIWGGAVSLSPADDILIRVERALDLDSQGQLIASVLSKKVAAGSNYIVIDVPIGSTAKVRSYKEAQQLKEYLEIVADKIGVNIKVAFTDGTQPVGCGIGPSLEARDVVNVLKCEKDAPEDLRDRALTLAGILLEFSDKVEKNTGKLTAQKILDSGEAWKKFQAICEAQGGLRQIPKAKYTHPYLSSKSGKVTAIDNRKIARVAKLAGAPGDPAAGIDLHVKIGSIVNKDDPLFTVHAESEGELIYAFAYLRANECMTLE